MTPLYTTVNAKLEMCLNKLKPLEFRTILKPVLTHESSKEIRVKLPKLKLPIFDGSITYWEGFWDQFNASINPVNSQFGILKSLTN